MLGQARKIVFCRRRNYRGDQPPTTSINTSQLYLRFAAKKNIPAVSMKNIKITNALNWSYIVGAGAPQQENVS